MVEGLLGGGGGHPKGPAPTTPGPGSHPPRPGCPRPGGWGVTLLCVPQAEGMRRVLFTACLSQSEAATRLRAVGPMAISPSVCPSVPSRAPPDPRQRGSQPP